MSSLFSSVRLMLPLQRAGREARLVAAATSLLMLSALVQLPTASAQTQPFAAAPAAPGAADPVTEAADRPAASAAARAQGSRVESVADRTETETVWGLPDGRFEADLYGAPIRYKDPDGAWHDVDVTLRQDLDGAVVPLAHPRGLRLAGPGGTADTVRELASLEGGKVVLGWKGALPQPVLDGYTATYPEVTPGVDLIVTATRTGFEQFFRLNSRPPAGTAPTFRLPLTGQGLTVSENAEGGLTVAEVASGKTVGSAPAPKMWGEAEDVKSGEPARAANVAMKVAKTANGSSEVVLEPDPAFLADPSVTYPLIIDPAVTLYTSSDTLIQNDLTSNQNGGTELKAGTYNSGTVKARSLIKFNVSALDNAHVLNADFLAWNFYSASCTAKPVGLHRITSTWSPASVTWSNNPPSQISTPFVSMTESNGYNANCPAGYIHFDNTGLHSLVQQWIDGVTANYGFAIRAGNETDSLSWKRFHSADYAGSRIPRLSVTYALAPGTPTIGAVIPGNASASVAWTPPADNGGSAITSYSVIPYVGATPGTPINATSSPANIPGLANGTAYTFKVLATNVAGNSGYSGPSEVVTPRTIPAAPTSVTATAGNSSAEVSWTPPTNNGGSAITGYTVTATPGGASANAPAGATSAPVIGLTNGTAYTFTVKAANIAGPGPDSTPSGAVTPRTVPAAPAAPTAIGQNGGAQVNWTAPNNGGDPITGYTLTPYDGATPGAAVEVTGTPPATSTGISGLTNGTAYTFKVKATNATGTGQNSPPSDPVTPQAPATTPAPPTQVAAEAGNGSAQVSWTAPDDGGAPITGYTITPHDGTTAGTPVTVTGTPPATTKTITGLANGTAYTFTVTATNSAGTSDPSAPSTPVTPRTVPAPPQGLSATGGNEIATLTWTPPASDGGAMITGYTVTATPGGATTEAPAGATGATVTGLTNGTAYTFTVFASNAAGAGATSQPSAPVTPATTPGAPTAVNTTSGDGQLAVSWTPPASNGGAPITGYTVWANPGAISVPAAAGATTATVTGLSNGTPYTITVTATNTAGIGTESSPITATPAAAPDAPTQVGAVPGNTEATVTWTAPTGDGGAPVTGYTVTATPGGATADVVGDGAPPTTTATVTGLTNGTAYTFTVAATNAAGTGAASDASAAVTPTDGLPQAPTAVSAAAGNAQAVITWTAPTDPGGSPITSYTVTASPGGATATTPDGSTTNATVTGLTNGTAYTFVVLAHNNAGPGLASDPSAAVTPGSIPGPVTGVTAAGVDRGAYVSWTPPESDGGSPITGYTVTAAPGGASATTTGATNVTVQGLQNSSSYTFTVTAHNGFGGSAVSPATAPATAQVPRITSSGPITQISINKELQCTVIRAVTGIDATQCATSIKLGDTVYTTPISTVVYTSGLVSSWGPVSQTPVTGSGTAADPYQIETVVAAGATSVRLHQTDRYVVGDDFYSTEIAVTGAAAGGRVYRSIACAFSSYASPAGYGGVSGKACLVGGRTVQLLGSAGAISTESTPEAVKTFVYNGERLTDSCAHCSATSPGAGAVALAWDVTGEATLRSVHRTTVGPPPAQSYGNGRCNSAGTPRPQQLRADPVNTATGALSETFTDAAMPAPGVPFSFTRAYTSLDGTVGPLGRGWTHPYDARLSVDAVSGVVHLRAEDGQQVRFIPDGAGGYAGADGVRSTLTPAAEGAFWLSTPCGRVLGFNNEGLLTSIADRTGQGLSLDYNGARLDTITDAAGRTVSLSYTGTHLTRVSLPDGRHVDYGYSADLLTTVTDLAGNTTTYTYDTGGRLAAIVDPLGHELVRNTYNTTSGRILTQRDAEGKTTTFAATASGTTGLIATMTAPDGGQWVDTYNGGVLITSRDPLGNTTDYFHDAAGRLDHTRNPRGNRTFFTYDARGNVTHAAAPGVVESRTVNLANDPVSVTDRRGRVTSYTYTANGQLQSLTNPAGGTTTYGYGPTGLLTASTDARSNTTNYGHDGDGNLTSITSPSGALTTHTYDSTGRRTSTVSARGNVAGADPGDYTTSYTYDDANRLLTATDPRGNTTSFGYDAAGRRTSMTDAANHTTTYGYDNTGRVITVTDPAGGVTTTTYDHAGRVLSVTTPQGRATTYTYDLAGRQTAATGPRGNASGADPTAHTWRFGYDANGNRTSATHPDPDGGADLVTTTAYDTLDRPTSVTDPRGKASLFTYDANDNLTKITDPLGNFASSGYDHLNRRTTVTDQRGKTTTFTYDANGNRTSLTTPLGGKSTYTYDPDNRLISFVDPRGNAAGANPDTYRTTYTYNPDGALSAVTDPMGNATTYGYDAAGNRTTATDPNGHATETVYDALNRASAVTGPDGGAASVTYDQVGNLTTRTDANNHTSTYGYDGDGLATSLTRPGGQQWTYQYDPAGNLKRTETPAGHATPADGDGLITRTFDSLNRATAVNYSDATPDVGYSYDRAGRLTTLTDGAGEQGYTYDNANRLTGLTRTGADFAYNHDAAGNITSRTYPDGTVIAATYDNDSRLATLTRDSATTTFGYDPAGHLATTTLPSGNGHVETRTYDPAGRLTAITNARAGGVLSAFTNTLDPAGNPTSLTTTRGATTTQEAYTYDPADRLTQICPGATSCAGASGPTLSYTYDDAGNRLTQTRAGGAQPGTTTYTYNAADELTATSDGASTTNYTYDPNGNRITRGNDTYTYNLADQLTAATVDNAAHAYTYDGHGNRITATTGAATTRTAWDGALTVAQPAVDTDNAGTTLASYLHGPAGPLSITAGGQTTYTHRNRVGSITDLTNGNGTAQRIYDYDAFGTARTDTELIPGAPTSPLRFAGERLDPTGDYHLRARQYDPTTGRFSALDPILQATGEPYQYAGNSPLLYTDPTGLLKCGPFATFCDGAAAARDAIGASVTSNPFTPGANPAADFVASQITSGPGEIAAKAAVAFGNGASFGGAEKLVAQLSPGAECYYADLGAGYQLIEAIGAAISAELGAALVARGAAALLTRNGPGLSLSGSGAAAKGVDEAGALVRYDPKVASRNLLGQIGDGYAVTRGGRTVSAHAAQRIVYGAPGRSPTTLARVDDILDNPTKMVYRPSNDTVRVYQGKEWVVVSGTGPQHIVTVMIR